jgi:hypothetical protein
MKGFLKNINLLNLKNNSIKFIKSQKNIFNYNSLFSINYFSTIVKPDMKIVKSLRNKTSKKNILIKF